MAIENPLFTPSIAPFGLPPFDILDIDHFMPAYTRAMAEHDREIAAIADDPSVPTFENTIAALERAGAALSRAGESFWLLASTCSTPQTRALESELAPQLAAHYNAIGMNEKLLNRVADLWARRDRLGLTPEQAHLLKLTHDSFKRSGALLSPEKKRRFSQIAQRLATLYAQFSQNVLADETDWAMFLDKADLDGLPESQIQAAARSARERGQDGKYAITLSRSSIEPFLASASRRDLRARAFEAWIKRGEMNPQTDNRAIITEIVRLRAEMAALLGYESYAHYKLEDQMAKSPERVQALLERVWRPALAKAAEERAILAEYAQRAGENHQIVAADWRYYADKARRERHAIDDTEISSYLCLENVIAAAFDCATRLFGVTFAEVFGLHLHHPDARAFEVKNAAGDHVALFIGDYFARPGKRGGAWMSALRVQRKLDQPVAPIVVNVLNFVKGGEGAPTQISMDDARTLFHEFGHALHGMLSDVVYPSISGTNVPRDFVEFPSQLYEHWLSRPEILSRFARHAKTGEPMPAELIERIHKARAFNQGFATLEYASCALVDLHLHMLAPGADFDVVQFEAEELARLKMPEDIAMRHRTPHFSHLFANGGYAAGYYSYLWSEVLDADGFNAFEEAGDIFAPDVAKRLKDYVYSAGAREEPEQAYRHFRGRDPDPRALIQKRGLRDDAA